ncbi:MAG: TetR/AcrR family transcriptional regulator [Haloechinothrix sp.]
MTASESGLPEPPARGRRPRNRRELIVAAAAELFYRRGYSRVGMNDVADAVAISRPALYRHFTGKQQMLTEVVGQAIARTAEALAGADTDDLDSVLRAVGRAVLDHREAGVLWQRDSRHLPAEQRTLLREQTQDIGRMITGLLLARRPELTEPAASLLTWCALAVATSVSFHNLELPREDYEDLLADMVRQVVGTTLPRPSPRKAGEPEAVRPALTSQSRWETLLATATTLFAEQGYASVGMHDIAAAVGIAGPSIYHHFAGKSDILVQAMNRGAEWLRYDMERALAGASDHAAGLHLLLRAYSGFVLEHNHLVDLLINEASELPAATRLQVSRTARDYLGDWAYLLRVVHPELDETRALIRVQAVLSVINNIARSPRLRQVPGVAESLQRIGAAVLKLPRL